MNYLSRIAMIATSSASIFLAGCNQNYPSQVSIKLNSSEPLKSTDWSMEKSTIGSCNLSGYVNYDIDIEPKDFTGNIWLSDVVISYNGYKHTGFQQLNYLNGKPTDRAFNIGQYVYASQDDKEEYKAICGIKSYHNIKIVSLGKPVIALPGIPLVIDKQKD